MVFCTIYGSYEQYLPCSKRWPGELNGEIELLGFFIERKIRVDGALKSVKLVRID